MWTAFLLYLIAPTRRTTRTNTPTGRTTRTNTPTRRTTGTITSTGRADDSSEFW